MTTVTLEDAQVDDALEHELRISEDHEVEAAVAPPWWAVFVDIDAERHRQMDRWGPQSHPDLTGQSYFQSWADEYRRRNDARTKAGREVRWSEIWLEEVFEALAEKDPARLRQELVQAAAVAVAWIEDLDSRAQLHS